MYSNEQPKWDIFLLFNNMNHNIITESTIEHVLPVLHSLFFAMSNLLIFKFTGAYMEETRKGYEHETL